MSVGPAATVTLGPNVECSSGGSVTVTDGAGVVSFTVSPLSMPAPPSVCVSDVSGKLPNASCCSASLIPVIAAIFDFRSPTDALADVGIVSVVPYVGCSDGGRSTFTTNGAGAAATAGGSVMSITPLFGTPTEPSVAPSSVSGRLSLSRSPFEMPAPPSVCVGASSAVVPNTNA